MAKAVDILDDFREGRQVRTFPSFFKLPEYEANRLSQSEKRLWINVFEKVFSRGDSKLNSEDWASAFMAEIKELDFGIELTKTEIPEKKTRMKVTKKPKKVEQENPEEETHSEEEAEEERPYTEHFRLVEKYDEGEEYGIADDQRKKHIFEILRTDDVFLLQFDWVIFHFGSKFATYLAKIEHFKLLLVEMSRPIIGGDPEKREARLVNRNKVGAEVEKIQQDIDRIRWELFGIQEEKVREITHINRHAALSKRIKEANGKK